MVVIGEGACVSGNCSEAAVRMQRGPRENIATVVESRTGLLIRAGRFAPPAVLALVVLAMLAWQARERDESGK